MHLTHFGYHLLKNVLSLRKVFKITSSHQSTAYRPTTMISLITQHATGKSKITPYYPLWGPTHPGEPGDDGWNPWNLPACTINNFYKHLNIILHPRTVTQCKELETCYGINEESALLQIPSILFPSSFPHDTMHLYFENILPMLCDHWISTGKYTNQEPADDS